jgi:hypothetical protein
MERENRPWNNWKRLEMNSWVFWKPCRTSDLLLNTLNNLSLRKVKFMHRAERMPMSLMESHKALSKRRKGKGLMTRNKLYLRNWAPIIMFSMPAIKKANKTSTKINMAHHLLIIFLLELMPDMVPSKITSQVIFKTIMTLSLVTLKHKTTKKECSQVRILTTSTLILM